MDIRSFFCSSFKKKEEVVTETPLKKREKSIKVFTDGSSFNNGSKKKQHYGGIGIFFSDYHEDNTSICLLETKDTPVTNNIAELKACIKAIEIINDSVFSNYDKIIVYTDSEYTINSITKWAPNWKKNNWKRKSGTKMVDIKNKDLIEKLYNLYNLYTVELRHVRAHKSEPLNKESEDYRIWYGNMMADKLARDASKAIQYK